MFVCDQNHVRTNIPDSHSDYNSTNEVAINYWFNIGQIMLQHCWGRHTSNYAFNGLRSKCILSMAFASAYKQPPPPPEHPQPISIIPVKVAASYPLSGVFTCVRPCTLCRCCSCCLLVASRPMATKQLAESVRGGATEWASESLFNMANSSRIRHYANSRDLVVIRCQSALRY